MKTMLLILMVLASVAMAQATMSDAKMKKLLVGTWTVDCTRATTVFHADGTSDDSEKWDIKDGEFMEIVDGDRTYYYKIILLTKHEFLVLGMTVHAHGYFFYWRKDED